MTGGEAIPVRVTLELPDGTAADWPLMVSSHGAGATGEVLVYRADIPGFGQKDIPGPMVQV
jgi:hypothetical protein